ncbi:hypothetical protein pEaSNUABM11_00237 [Erwinia phage pEa_SNUABM_11]|nr:hypothetical protein pEaSNUABM11_00237 [Erwinia phage pEa_SNUABM_11]
MLRVVLPELYQLTTPAAEKLFNIVWDRYCPGKIADRPELWVRRDEFYLGAYPLFVKTFAVAITGMLDAVNLGRDFDIHELEFNYEDIYNDYQHEDLNDEMEGEVLLFMNFVEGVLGAGDAFLDELADKLGTPFQTLLGLRKQHNILGFWLDVYATDMRIWEDNPTVFAIQEGDFEPQWHDKWYSGPDSKFYELAKEDGMEFYYWAGNIVAESPRATIPEGEPVTLCHLTHEAVAFMEPM